MDHRSERTRVNRRASGGRSSGTVVSATRQAIFTRPEGLRRATGRGPEPLARSR